jgi:catalase
MRLPVLQTGFLIHLYCLMERVRQEQDACREEISNKKKYITIGGTIERPTRTIKTNRDHLVGNIVWHLSQGVERFIQERAVKSYLYPVDPDLGVRVAKGLGLEITPEPAASVGKDQRK